MHRQILVACACLLSACSGSPTRPSATIELSPSVVSLEGEAGFGDGQVVQRSRASGGETIHLGPGEQRRWNFDVGAPEARYALAITYSNSKGGDNEIISVRLNGATIRTFANRDSGEDSEGWDLFVTDAVGESTLATGDHTLELEVSGGDGCVEIDRVTLTPGS